MTKRGRQQGAHPAARYVLTVISSPTDLVDDYLTALRAADLEAMVALFAEGAVVRSPLYGPMPAPEFYRALFADTSASTLTLRSVMTGTDQDGAPTVAFWFRFDWLLASGAPAPFEVVDVATLTPQGTIAELRLIYDTVDVRPVFEAETGTRSWRTAGSSR